MPNFINRIILHYLPIQIKIQINLRNHITLITNAIRMGYGIARIDSNVKAPTTRIPIKWILTIKVTEDTYPIRKSQHRYAWVFFDSLLTSCLFIDLYSKKSQKSNHFSYLKCSKNRYNIFKHTQQTLLSTKTSRFRNVKKKGYYLTNTNNRANFNRNKIESHTSHFYNNKIESVCILIKTFASF